MKDEIIAVVADHLDINPADLDESRTLEDLQIDSLDLVEIMFEVEETFDAPLISEIQEQRHQIHKFGDMLRITEELIRQHRAAESARPSA